MLLLPALQISRTPRCCAAFEPQRLKRTAHSSHGCTAVRERTGNLQYKFPIYSPQKFPGAGLRWMTRYSRAPFRWPDLWRPLSYRAPRGPPGERWGTPAIPALMDLRFCCDAGYQTATTERSPSVLWAAGDLP
ncbi:hypothetical protein DPEC_G00261830 [Dallia pectoralis]|uniref:Uncharacterized protein n=1 Tax=Dallia pectoralis TaxID=75939 RepID=A0ACC2FRT7_DALPE|nr:hypothetical protein DPEC_G00261830 [Dallia pectoralis]